MVTLCSCPSEEVRAHSTSASIQEGWPETCTGGVAAGIVLMKPGHPDRLQAETEGLSMTISEAKRWLLNSCGGDILNVGPVGQILCPCLQGLLLWAACAVWHSQHLGWGGEGEGHLWPA